MIIDVSKWQGVIDWERVKPQIDGAIIRCGLGDDIKRQDDTQFSRNMQECIRLNINVLGVYIYSYAKTNEQAKSEAAHVLRLLNPYNNKNIKVALDLEENGTESGAVERARIFAQEIKAAGYDVVIYANEYWWTHYLVGLDEFPKWVAKYSDNAPNVSGNIWLWQYASDGHIDGINGNVDVNKPMQAYTAPQPQTQPKAVDTNVNVEYQVGTADRGILPTVINYNDFAGIRGHKINGFCARVNHGGIKYRAHFIGGGWCDWCYDGQWCGNGAIFDAVQIYYSTPDDIKAAAGYKRAVYRVAPISKNYYTEQIDDVKDAQKGLDGYAGAFGVPFDCLQIKVE